MTLSSRRWMPLLCVAVLPLGAQTIYTGELTGNVTDPTGKMIAGATVDLTSGATGEKSSIVTTATGDFRFPLLRPGPYTLTVSATGFELKTQPTTIELGQSSNLPIQLGIPAKKEDVFVTEQAPLLQNNNANLATTFNQREIESLPDPGNDITAVVFLAPGVTMDSTGGYAGGSFSVFGLPSISNLFTIDGMDNTLAYQNLNVTGASGNALGVNEIQEAAVVLNGYTGQYGRMAGANVNYITKSGANAFHGNALWDYNERVLNANNWFNDANGVPNPFAISNSWAGSLGGPIVKNKLFFFFDNEGMRYVQPISKTIYVPTPDFANFVLNRLGDTNPAYPLYQTAFNLYAGASGAARAKPLSNIGASCGNFTDTVSGYGISKPCEAEFLDTTNSLDNEWLAAAKVDFNITSNDRIYLRLNMDHGSAVTVNPINPVFSPTASVPSYRGQFGYTKIVSPHSVNSLVLSAADYSLVAGPADLSAALRAFPTTFTFTQVPYQSVGGQDNGYPSGTKPRQWQLVDDYSFIHGHHTLRAGVNLRENFVSSYFYGAQTSGLLTFNTMTDFVNASLTSKSSTYAQAFPNIGAEELKFSSNGFYGQDEWRLRPNLTITLALRLDRNSNISCNSCFTELADQGSFETVAHAASIPYNQTIATGLNTAFHSVDAITPEPRLGVAYNLTKSTVLRGGAGLFSDTDPGMMADRFLTNAPAEGLFTTTSGLVAQGVTNGVFDILSASNTALQQGFSSGETLAQIQTNSPAGYKAPNFFTISQDVHTPKYAEWNAEVQQEFADRYLLSVNYVGNHGFDELIQEVFDNGYSPGGYGGLPTTAPDPRFGQIIALNTQGWSNYNGLVTSFRWRVNAQFSGQFSYTWSHSLDTCSNDCFTEIFGPGSERFQLNPQSLRANYSNSDYDVRHTLNAHYIYTVPASYFHNSMLKGALGGWVAAGTVFFHTGFPFSIVDSGVLGRFGNLSGKVPQPFLADFLGTLANGTQASSYPSCTTPNLACYSVSQFAPASAQDNFGNIPRNSFRGPGFFDTDLNLNKTISIAEKYRLRIGASFFNILNHPNFGLPASDVNSPSTLGLITTMAGQPIGSYGLGSPAGRVIQTQIKFSF